MTCTIPIIENFSQAQVEYNVDVAINGQQFSGFPMIYRFYDITIQQIFPNISLTEGGLQMKISGTGLFDSVTKKARITSILGERYTEIQWDRTDKALILGSIPLNWITSDDTIIKTEKTAGLYNKYAFTVLITMNNTQWIEAGSFRYCEPTIEKISYIFFKDNQIPDDRLLELSQKAPLTDDEKQMLGQLPPIADKKKATEFEKKMKEENDAIELFKRPYNGLALFGNFFPDTQSMQVRFASELGDTDAVAFYKNENKIACLIPG